MDTHFVAYSEFAPETAARLAAITGAPADKDPADPATAAHEAENASAAQPPVGQINPRRRWALLAGVAAAGLLTAVTGAFLASPYNHIIPIHRRASLASTGAGAPTLADPLAPAASLAKVTLPPAETVTRPKFVPPPRDQEVAEVLSFHAGARSLPPAKHEAAPKAVGQTEDQVNAAELPPGYVPSEPGTAQPPQSVATGPKRTSATQDRDATAAVLASLPPPAPAQTAAAGHALSDQAQAPTAPVSAPVAQAAPTADPVSTALKLIAGPMTPPEQVQVLNLVTEIAVMVKDLQKQAAQLRADISKSSAGNAARLGDVERRLALAEAAGAVTAAKTATDVTPVRPAASPSPTELKVVPATLTQTVPVTAAATAAPSPGVVKLYRVQAASPGLALLAETGRGGGDGAQIEVSVGDSVPGYGHVRSIAQKGTTWVIATEHGQIQ